jgi:hypothetical protein
MNKYIKFINNKFKTTPVTYRYALISNIFISMFILIIAILLSLFVILTDPSFIKPQDAASIMVSHIFVYAFELYIPGVIASVLLTHLISSHSSHENSVTTKNMLAIVPVSIMMGILYVLVYFFFSLFVFKIVDLLFK